MSTLLITNRDLPMTQLQGLEILRVANAEAVDEALLGRITTLIVDGYRTEFAVAVATRVRTNPTEAVYLMPLFLFTTEPVTHTTLNGLIDGVTDLTAMATLMDRAGRINERLSQLSSATSPTQLLAVALRLLRMLHTRNRQLDPVMSQTSVNAFIYPFLALSFSDESQRQSFDVIDHALREDLLEGEFRERLFSCPDCHSAFLLTRETCSNCASSDLKTVDMIHHFVCAYVGPERDFNKGGKLVCPKCSEVVRHIGVDYDKPSMVYECNNCEEQSQDINVRSLCVSCRESHSLEELRERRVMSLRITPKGEHAAIHGFSTSIKDLLRLEGVVEYDVFKVMLGYEISRVARSKRPTSIGLFRFENYLQIVAALKSNRGEVFNEFAAILKQNVRTSDVVSYYNDSTIVILFTETPEKGAEIIVGRIHNLMSQLIEDNADGVEPNIFSNYVTLEEYLPMDQYLDQLFQADEEEAAGTN